MEHVFPADAAVVVATVGVVAAAVAVDVAVGVAAVVVADVLSRDCCVHSFIVSFVNNRNDPIIRWGSQSFLIVTPTVLAQQNKLMINSLISCCNSHLLL